MSEGEVLGERRESSEFAERMSEGLETFGIVPIERERLAQETPLGEFRRAGRRRREDNVGRMTLFEADGVLRWQYGVGAAPARRGGPRRGWRRPRRAERIVKQYKFEELPPNKVGALLAKLDGRLTPNQGLRRVNRTGGIGRTEVAPVSEGRILLFVHGTFSNAESVLEEIGDDRAGRAFLGRVFDGTRDGAYDQVLAFNHPTLSVSPVLNAATLARCFRESRAEVDIVCHSRGGLVSRWWLEMLDACPTARGRVVFAGAPLGGTGLAAPANLKGALDALTNLASVLGKAATTAGRVFPIAAPLGEAVGILFSTFGRITSIASHTPILDAGVALIPGLAGQSREGANGEIVRLRSGFESLRPALRRERFDSNYYFIRSNFETEDPGWAFWRYFRDLKGHGADALTNAIFTGENDLVVDTPSMTELADEISGASWTDAYVKRHVLDFGTSSDVHHCSYFQQARTYEFLTRALGL